MRGNAALRERPEEKVSAGNFGNPVVRVGQLAKPAFSTSPRERPLNYEEGERAEKELFSHSADFDSALRTAIEDGLRKHHSNGGLLNNTSVNGIRLRPPKRGPNLGLVFDFSEIAFQLDGAIVVARACVTVCVQGSVIKPTTKASLEYNSSKFWVRFIYLGETGSDLDSNGLSVNALREFDDRCQFIGENAIRRMEIPYRDAIRAVTGDDALSIVLGPRVFALTVGTLDPDFHALYGAIMNGEKLSKHVDSNGVARELAELATAYYPSSKFGKRSQLRNRIDAGVDLITYEGEDNYRGIFLRKVDDDTLASFVGVAQSPSGADNARQVVSNPANSAANVVSAGLITAFASLL